MRRKNGRAAPVLEDPLVGDLLAKVLRVRDHRSSRRHLLLGVHQLAHGLGVHVESVVRVEVLFLDPDLVVAAVGDFRARVVDPVTVDEELVLVVSFLQVHNRHEVLSRSGHWHLGPVIEGA